MRHRSPILFVLALVAACATSKDAVLTRTLAGLDAAHTAFEAMDTRRQADLVERAQTMAEGKAALASHRARRDKVEDGFIAAYSALALASLERSDLNLGRLVQLATEAIVAFRGWTL